MPSLNLPVPTDNLYKFIAIFGLLIFLFSISFIFVEFNYCYSAYINILNEKSALDADLDFSSYLVKTSSKNGLNKVEKFRNIIKAKRNINPAEPGNQNYDEIHGIIGEIRADLFMATIGNEMVKEDFEKKRKIVIDEAIYKVIKQQITTIIMIYMIPLLLGIITMITGFVMWYKKLQIYQDRVIESESIKIKIKKVIF